MKRALANRQLARLRGALARSTSVARLAAKVRDQLHGVVVEHLGHDIDMERNGERWILEELAPRAKTFVDVGANVGEWTSMFLALAPDARGWVFDASSSATAQLDARFSANPRVSVRGQAMSDRAGEVVFFEEPDAGHMSSIVPGVSRDAKSRTVHATTVDILVAAERIERLDYLKIDAEGHDLSILRGCSQSLHSHKLRAVQFEYNVSWQPAGSLLADAFALFERHGYEAFLLKGRKLFRLPYEIYGEFFHYANFVAFPRERVPENLTLDRAADLKGSGVARSARRTLVSNTAALYVLQAVNYAFPLLVIPYLLRTIGVGGFGEMAFAGAVVMAWTALVEFSFNYTATALVAKHVTDPLMISRVYSVVMVSKLLLVGASSLGLVAVTLLVPRLRAIWPLVAAQWPMLVGEALFPLWLFQGLQRLGFVTGFHLVSRVVTLVLLFVFVHAPGDAVLAAGIQSLHFVVAGVAAQCTARWLLGVRFDRFAVKPMSDTLVRDSARLFAGSLGQQVYVRAPMVIVGLVADASTIGAFAVAQKLAGLFTALVTPVAQSLYPHLCSLGRGRDAEFNRLRKTSLVAVLIGLTGAAAVSNLAAKWVLGHFTSSDVAMVSSMILMYSPVIVISGANTLLAAFVMASKRYDEFRRMLLAAAGVFFAVALPLAYLLGTYGVIAASLTVEAFVFASCLWISRRSRRGTSDG